MKGVFCIRRRRKPSEMLCLLLTFILVLSTVSLIQVTYIRPVQASPATMTIRPTKHGIVGLTVVDGELAYDGLTYTAASFDYGHGTEAPSYFEVFIFDAPDYEIPISAVDFTMRYSADANTKEETYAIEYYLAGVGPVTLVPATSAAKILSTVTWADQPRPGGGSWTWADIDNINFTVTVSKKAGSSEDSFFYEYEAYVTVHFTPPAYSTVYVDPDSVIDTGLAANQTLTLGVDGEGTNSSHVDWSWVALTPDGNGTYADWNSSSPTYISPDDNGTYTDWTGYARDWDDWPSHDGDATNVTTNLHNKNETSTLTNPPFLNVSIRKVRLTVVARNNMSSDENMTLMLVIGGNGYNGSIYTLTTSYAEYSHEWSTNPATTSAWTWSDIDALEAGVRSQQNGSAWTGELIVTQLYVSVFLPKGVYTYWDDQPSSLPGDGDTTCLNASDNNVKQSSTLENPPLGPRSYAINNVRLTIVARNTLSPYEFHQQNVTLMLVIGGTSYNGSHYDGFRYTLTSSYAVYCSEWPTNPATTSAWTWSDIDALEAGVHSQINTTEWTGELRVTQLYVSVSTSGDYTLFDESSSHDGDTTYIYADLEKFTPQSMRKPEDTFETATLEDHTAETWTIAAVRVHMVSRTTDPNSDEKAFPLLHTLGWPLGGAHSRGVSRGKSFAQNTTYQEYTSEWALNPSTENFWTWADIDNLEVGVGSTTIGARTGHIRVTQLYVVVLGERLSVDIKVDFVENMRSYEHELLFNPDVIRGVYVLEGVGASVRAGETFLESAGGSAQPSHAPWNNTLGRLSLGGGSVVGSTPTGGGTLSTLVFWIIRQGDSDLTLGEDTALYKDPPPTPNPVDRILNHSYFRNVDTSLLPTMSFTATPEDTPPANGTIQGFNVNLTSYSTAAGAKSITTTKWFFWERFREKFATFAYIVLRPNDTGTYSAWTNDYTYWDDVTPDHDTTYVSANAANLDETSSLKDYTAETWPITKIRIQAVARQTGENLSMRLMLVVGGNGYYGQIDHTPTNTYAPYTETWTKNPATDSAWTWSDINSLEVGVRSKNVSATWAGELRVTQLYIEVSAPPSIVGSNTKSLLRTYLSRGEWNVTLTVIDDADVVGIKTGYVAIKSHDIFFTEITTNTVKANYPVVNFTEIGNVVEINVTAVNQGDFTETFHVSTFWSVLVAGEYQRDVIATQTWITLAAGANTTLTFNWDTSGRNVTHPQAFALSANASRIPYEWDIEWAIGKVAPNEYKGDAIRVRHHDIAITDVSLSNYLSISPNGDGTYTQWKNGSYLDWDEQPPGHDGDATYILANVTNLYESSTLQDHTTETWSIGKVRVTIVARTNVTTDEQVQLMLVNSTTGERHISAQLHSMTNVSYSKYSSEWSENPSTSSAWTWSHIDALEAGVKSTRGGWPWVGEIRVTQLYVEVLGTPQTAMSVTAGDIVDISVKVLNEGDFNETSIDVTAYYGASSISTQTISVLTNKSFSDEKYAYYGKPDNYTVTLEFLWDTTSVSDATYTIKAIASTVTDEYDTGDNTYIDGTVTVGVPVPEFPFGAALEMALLAAIIYVWWKRKPKTKQKNRLLRAH